MKIAIGADHAGFGLKEDVLGLLKRLDHEIIDCGTYNTESVDYPDFGEKVSKMVSAGEVERGVLICGTGIGMSMVANKFPNVRAALCNDLFSARMSRLHNDANIIVLPARFISQEEALQFVRVFFTTEFEGGRHQQRVEKINNVL